MQHLEGCFIGSRSGTHDDIGSESGKERENLPPEDFPKPPFQAVTLHDRMPVLWNDDADSWMTQKGSEDPNLEVFGSSSLPFTQDLLQIRPPGETNPTGVGSVLRRRRTWSAAGR